MPAACPGDGVELRLPDGRIRHETIGQIGVDGWRHEGQFYTASNPEDPEITVTVAGELRPEDVPPGTPDLAARPRSGAERPRGWPVLVLPDEGGKSAGPNSMIDLPAMTNAIRQRHEGAAQAPFGNSASARRPTTCLAA